MDLTLAITLWMASGAAIGGVVTPLIVQSKRISDWWGMWAGIVIGMVGNVLALLPLWLLIIRELPDRVDQSTQKRGITEQAEGQAATQPSAINMVRAAAAHLIGQPSPYKMVFAILALFTVMETGVAYLPDLPEGVRVGVLGFLAATKAYLVLLYFMHLKSDYRVFALPFAIGLILVIPLVLIVGLTTGEASAPSSGQAVLVATETGGGGGQASQDQLVSEGQQLFSNYCAMCHGAQSNVGPSFDGMTARAENRVRGESAKQYIHESIVDPSAYVVNGYQDMMPKDFGQKFNDEQLGALVAYIMAQSSEE